MLHVGVGASGAILREASQHASPHRFDDAAVRQGKARQAIRLPLVTDMAGNRLTGLGCAVERDRGRSPSTLERGVPCP
jgi:hypothetical protein